MTITATRPAPATPARTVASPAPARTLDDVKEEARRALQASLDTRQ